MPDDVRAALERFQNFVEAFGAGSVIDEASGFTTADAQLLIGEIELGTHPEPAEENPVD